MASRRSGAGSSCIRRRDLGALPGRRAAFLEILAGVGELVASSVSGTTPD
jgi:hypothetical protein